MLGKGLQQEEQEVLPDETLVLVPSGPARTSARSGRSSSPKKSGRPTASSSRPSQGSSSAADAGMGPSAREASLGDVPDPLAAARLLVRQAQQALEVCTAALNGAQEDLKAAERKHRAAVNKHRMLMDAEHQSSLAGGPAGACRRRCEAARRLRRVCECWVDPDSLQQQMRAARDVGVEARLLEAADATWQARSRQLQQATQRVLQPSTVKHYDTARQAKAMVIADELSFLSQGHEETPAAGPRLSMFARLRSTVREASSLDPQQLFIDAALLSRAREREQQLAERELQQTMDAPDTLESIRHLASVIELCAEAGFADETRLEQLLRDARRVMSERQPQRVALALASLRQLLAAGIASVETHAVAHLEEAVCLAEEAVEAAESDARGKEGESRDIALVRELAGSAQVQLRARRDVLAAQEEERRETAWQESRKLLERLVASAQAAVDANKERLQVAQEQARLLKELNEDGQRQQQVISERGAALQQHVVELEEQVEQQQQETELAREEIRRLKWSIKLTQDGAQAARRQADEEIQEAKEKAEELVRQAKAEAAARRRDLEKVQSSAQSAQEKQNKLLKQTEERVKHEQERVRQEQERVAQMERRVKDEQQQMEKRVKEEQQQTEKVRQHLEHLRTEQSKESTLWRDAEKDAMALAKRNAEVAQNALAAQKVAEDALTRTKHEVTVLQQDIVSTQQMLKSADGTRERAVEQVEMRATKLREEGERLQAKIAELNETLKEERTTSKAAHQAWDEAKEEYERKGEETREVIEGQKNQIRELQERVKSEVAKTATARAEERELDSTNAKLKKELAEANAARKKAKEDIQQMSKEKTQANESRDEALKLKDEAEKALQLTEERVRVLLEEAAQRERAKTAVQAKHAKELEEQEAKYEKQLQQKEAQLEYAEDSLLRREKADSNALRKKMAAKKLADETQRFMTDKWKTAKDEAEMLRQQLTESKSRMEATKNKQLVAMREQKERDEKLLQQQHAETLKIKEEAQRLKEEKEKMLDAKRQAEEAASKRAAELAQHIEEQNLLRAKLHEAESRASSPERSVGAGGAGSLSSDAQVAMNIADLVSKLDSAVVKLNEIRSREQSRKEEEARELAQEPQTPEELLVHLEQKRRETAAAAAFARNAVASRGEGGATRLSLAKSALQAKPVRTKDVQTKTSGAPSLRESSRGGGAASSSMASSRDTPAPSSRTSSRTPPSCTATATSSSTVRTPPSSGSPSHASPSKKTPPLASSSRTPPDDRSTPQSSYRADSRRRKVGKESADDEAVPVAVTDRSTAAGKKRMPSSSSGLSSGSSSSSPLALTNGASRPAESAPAAAPSSRSLALPSHAAVVGNVSADLHMLERRERRAGKRASLAEVVEEEEVPHGSKHYASGSPGKGPELFGWHLW